MNLNYIGKDLMTREERLCFSEHFYNIANNKMIRSTHLEKAYENIRKQSIFYKRLAKKALFKEKINPLFKWLFK